MNYSISETLMKESLVVDSRFAAVFTLVAFLLPDIAAAADLESRLFDAVANEGVPAIKSLLDAGADVNALNGGGDSSLILASDQNNPGMVKLLIGAGANINAKDANGQTALMRAISVDFIAQDQYLATIKALINSESDLNVQDDDGFTALVHASLGHTSRGGLTDGDRPIMVGPPGGKAVLEKVYVVVVRMLLSRGADPSVRTGFDGNALMASAAAGYTDIVEELLRAGADIHAKDNQGVDALMQAANGGHLETVEYLIGAGADVNALNKFGTTALHAAVANGHQEIIELIRQARSEAAGNLIE